ncbi:MAG TPA: winged helix DNA-binding protein [Sphingomicrobium sp.]|nr:winged helix DNA-binding protein [Sphingomicrobium sp.]
MTDLNIAREFDPARPADTGERPGDGAFDDFRARSQFADVLSIRSAIQARAQRGRHLNPDLFADPAWDMLLELYSAALTQRKLTVSKLGARAGVPMTTALRWISTLEREGLIDRGHDRLDGRRVFLTLSKKGERAMSAYFDDLPAGTLFL